MQKILIIYLLVVIISVVGCSTTKRELSTLDRSLNNTITVERFSNFGYFPKVDRKSIRESVIYVEDYDYCLTLASIRVGVVDYYELYEQSIYVHALERKYFDRPYVRGLEYFAFKLNANTDKTRAAQIKAKNRFMEDITLEGEAIYKKLIKASSSYIEEVATELDVKLVLNKRVAPEKITECDQMVDVTERVIEKLNDRYSAGLL